MIRGEDHVLVHIDELEPAGVARDEGWKQMDIRFFDGAMSGSENTCLFRTVFPPGADADGVDEAAPEGQQQIETRAVTAQALDSLLQGAGGIGRKAGEEVAEA